MIHVKLDPLYCIFLYCKTDISLIHAKWWERDCSFLFAFLEVFCAAKKEMLPLAALLHPVIAFLMRRDEHWVVFQQRVVLLIVIF